MPYKTLGPLMRFSILFILLSVHTLSAQVKISTDKGEINFTSNAELELIKAHSNSVRGLIDVSSNHFAFSVDIKTFQGFNSPLQREHFLDNYMETHKYPTADFSGKIIEQIDFEKEGAYEVRAKGDLNIHGQKQIRIIKARVTIKNGKVSIESNFIVPLADHNISIPKIVSQKIATEIEINFKANMAKQ
jgi:hypothetical protein